jgi:hypothetical protein
MKYHHTVYLPALAIILALAWLLSGCASMCDPNDVQCKQDAVSDAADVGAGIGAALDVMSILDAPNEPTRTETRTCTTDFWGNQNCTVTVERH